MPYPLPKDDSEVVVVQPFIGSVRRECLVHVIVLNASGLRTILKSYVGGGFCRRSPMMCLIVSRKHRQRPPTLPDGSFQQAQPHKSRHDDQRVHTRARPTATPDSVDLRTDRIIADRSQAGPTQDHRNIAGICSAHGPARAAGPWPRYRTPSRADRRVDRASLSGPCSSVSETFASMALSRLIKLDESRLSLATSIAIRHRC